MIDYISEPLPAEFFTNQVNCIRVKLVNIFENLPRAFVRRFNELFSIEEKNHISELDVQEKSSLENFMNYYPGN